MDAVTPIRTWPEAVDQLAHDITVVVNAVRLEVGGHFGSHKVFRLTVLQAVQFDGVEFVEDVEALSHLAWSVLGAAHWDLKIDGRLDAELAAAVPAAHRLYMAIHHEPPRL